MATLMAEGIWPCTVQSANFGENDKKLPQVQINVRIDDGPSAGRFCTYEDVVDARSALYISRSCKSVGWKGGKSGSDLTTLKDDTAAWIAATGGKSTVEIKHIPIKNGKRAGEIWDKPNSIGRGPRVLKTASHGSLMDAQDAMRRAMEADGGSTPSDTDGGIDDNAPFATCSTVGLGEIAKVLK